MNITVIKEGEILRIIKSSEPILDGTKLTLYTPAEIDALAKHPTAWEADQLECAFQEACPQDSPKGTQAAWDAARESNQVLPRRVRSRGTARIN